MNYFDFTKIGGYRLKQFTFRKMQEAWLQILKMFVAFCNVPDVGNYVIQGCTIDGANITSGYLYIDGELCRFEESAGDLTTKIKKNVVIQSLGFKNGNSENVFRFTNAVTDAVDGAPLNAFTRVFPVFDGNYVHTDNNFSDLDKIKLAGIAPGAEVNVQSDFDVIDPTSDAYIKNKPLVPDVLKMHDYYVGDIGTDDFHPDTTVTINFPDVLTSDYQVLLTPVGVTGGNANNDISWVVFDKTPTSFSVALRGYSTDVQDIRLDYTLIKKTT
ncbi:hypothetical protein [Flavobacterium caeni]|uniref:Uncharacterized protein n=1 Tax=Flavobacterium caeni TaxID=490189 RepID=A0A1G5K2M8_9FLAO|nr:hypothetical protein [Flavobacterium caeni]SCY94863.1 hypothetical protein SAMN02927903_03059 [Flavobacterium caeni]